MKLIPVPYIDQSQSHPTGCECVTAVMLLRYLGVDIAVDEFIRRYIPVAEFERRDGELWGPDPREVFCGNPHDPEGMGCYAPVIRRALERALADAAPKLGRGFAVTDETGTPTRALLERYIDRDMPVAYWACINLRAPIPGPSWRLLGSGARFEWTSNEHCMLLVGYDDAGYFFNDPYENNGLVRYPKALTEERHAAQHSMAVAVWPL